MTERRGWAKLAAATSIALAGFAVIAVPRESGSGQPPLPGATGPASQPAYASATAAPRIRLLAVTPDRRTIQFSAAAGSPGHGRYRGHRALGPDATGGHAQQPPHPPAGVMAAGHPAAALAGRAAPALPAWRNLLESRWRQRLDAVIRLSVAYHDAADLSGHDAAGLAGSGPGEQAGTRQLRQLMQQAIAARQALAETEEALARLSAGSYGRCEQCRAVIAAARLVLEPEARYCGRCIRQATQLHPAALPAEASRPGSRLPAKDPDDVPGPLRDGK
ncbi:MAG TPA: TraR/DksA C4-type zinc finger protein [Streptosporangiaceae bacterium]|nr:TraR/DksA C4-type zinc finger protein [Streptosporangiaceae bacterium]